MNLPELCEPSMRVRGIRGLLARCEHERIKTTEAFCDGA
jgi:hypothetical protein